MESNHAYQAAAAWLARAKRPLLLSHRRPDGDALGSLAAMSLTLRAGGAEPCVALFDPLPARYSLIEPLAEWHAWEAARDSLAPRCDRLIVLDTCSAAQLEPAVEFLKKAPPTLVIDHHQTRDAGIGDRPGDLRVIDAAASSCARLVLRVCQAMPVRLGERLATALFTGMATDTGWFRFSNADADTLEAAARLVAAGARPAEIYDAIYQQEPAAKLRLIGRMLGSLEMHAGGKLAVLRLRRADFAASGADRGMTEDLINEVGRIGGTEATLLFTEDEAGVTRVNLRSKRVLDVAALAARHGGGGHVRAAGCRLTGDFEQVSRSFVDEAVASLS